MRIPASSSKRPDKECVLSIKPDGRITFLFEDTLVPLLALGDASIRRASHVEPSGTEWTADLAPVEGPTLGPFPLRSTALAAERQWLLDHDLPTPTTGA